jgi:hypothetical protein
MPRAVIRSAELPASPLPGKLILQRIKNEPDQSQASLKYYV